MFALWLLAQSAFYIVNATLLMSAVIVQWFREVDLPPAAFATAAMPVVMTLGTLIVSLIVWLKADRIAARMVADDPAPVTGPQITEAGVMVLACFAAGVFTIVPALRDLARSIAFETIGTWGPTNVWRNSDFWSAIIGVGISMWLMIKTRGIVALVLIARAAALKRGGESDATESIER